MGLIRAVTLPTKLYAHAEESDIGAVDASAKLVSLTLNRCTSLAPTIWANPSTFVEVEMLVTFDGGKTWVSGGGFGAYGGVHITRHGDEATFSGNLPWAYPGGGQMKVQWRVTNGPVLTAATFRSFTE